MLKKFAVIGLSAALALSPLAAIAQTDQTAAPAAPAAGAEPAKAPMKHKTHHHTSSMKDHSKMKKPAPAETPAAPAEAPKS
jgi:hypothetical protein